MGTQSDMVKFFAKHLDLIPEADATLRDLQLVKPTVSVMLDASMLDALEVLYANRVSGLALIDPEGGRVAANLSASDLRALSKNSFKDFDRSVLSYLSKSGQGVTFPETVSETATL